MKIITNEKVYVQRNDISTLLHFSNTLPNEVVNEVFSDVFICTLNNRHEFMEFSNPNTIEYFKKLDYILDYDEVKDLSVEDLNKLYLSVDKEISNLLIEFENLSTEEQEKKYAYYVNIINLKNYKLSSINDYTLYKKGKLKIKMPAATKMSISKEEKTKKRIRSIFNKERWTHRKNR